MRQTKTILLIEFYTMLSLALLLVVLFETGTVTAGGLLGDKQTEFALATAMEIITLVTVPVALKLFKIDKVRQRLQQEPQKSWIRFGTIRLSLVGVPMVVNTALYYQFWNVAFGYMAIIGLICLVFAYPCDLEINENGEKEQ